MASTTMVTSHDRCVMGHVPRFVEPPEIGEVMTVAAQGQVALFTCVGVSIDKDLNVVIEVELVGGWP
jgi:hypothetical protein